MVILPYPVQLILDEELGIVTRRRLVRGLNIRAAVVDGWVYNGHLQARYRGVYADPSAPSPPGQDAFAAVQRCGQGARAVGFMSLAFAGVEGFDFDDHCDVLVRPGKQVTNVPFRVTATDLPAVDLVTYGCVPGLRADRALMQVAPFVSEKRLRVGFDSARRLGLTSHERAEERILALQHLYGARLLGRIFATKAMHKESEGERALDRFLAPTGLVIDWAVSDLVPGRRLDGVIRDSLTVLEYDSRDHHVLPTDRDADGLRDLEVKAVEIDIGGYRPVRLEVLRITAGMIREQPDATRQWILQVHHQRLHELATVRAEGPTS
jgi:hypothetical protein